GTDQTAVKGQAAKGKKGIDGVMDKIIPVFETIEDLGADKPKNKGIKRHVPYPVVRPDTHFLFLWLGKFLFVLFVPLQTCQEHAEDDARWQIALEGHHVVLHIVRQRAVGRDQPDQFESQDKTQDEIQGEFRGACRFPDQDHFFAAI